MKIFTSKQLKELDAYTIKHEPIDSYDLMERAAKAMTNEVLQRFGTDRRVVVFAGSGNNGGDALAMARLLAGHDVKTEVYLFNIGSRISPECEKNAKRLAGIKKVKFTEITAQFEPVALSKDDIIIDGLFGTGLNKPLNGGFAGLVRYINSQPAYVISIDVPSGLMCEDNSFNVLQNIVRADMTLTVELPKLAFYFADMASYVGRVVTVPINLSKEYIEDTATPFSTTGREDVRGLLKNAMPSPIKAHSDTHFSLPVVMEWPARQSWRDGHV